MGRNFAFFTEYAMVKIVEPLIIPRKEHSISRKQVSPNALRTLYRLHAHGFIACLVGGCVRDLLLGRTPKDFDIGTNATPTQIRRLFRNCRLIGRRFRLAHLHFDDEIVEVSTFRRAAILADIAVPEEKSHAGQAGHEGREGHEAPEGLAAPDHPGHEPHAAPEGRAARYRRLPHYSKNEDGMVLLDNVFGTLEEDALRRDFTINALAYNIADFSVIDYSTGLSDLEQRLIRPIGDPRVRFTEDPVRMLRAVRFAASHDLIIEPVAWEILRELSSTISRASPARLYEEILKLFHLGSAQRAFSLLEKSGLLASLFSSLGCWISEESSRLTLLDAKFECIDRLYRSGAPASPSLLMAVLFGPSLDEAALARHRDGIPGRQALDEIFGMFVKDILKTVSVPGRISERVRAILALQTSLHRMPPRKPTSIIARPEFGEALAYLRLCAETRKEQTHLEWWDTFLLTAGSVALSEQPVDEPLTKKRRKRRRKRRGARQTVASPEAE
jgi:poly(A) polymerase